MATVAQPSTSQTGGFRRLWRALKQLFHEMTGAVFAMLALGWANAALRAYTRDVANWLIATAIGLTALMTFFAWTSFRRARRVQ